MSTTFVSLAEEGDPTDFTHWASATLTESHHLRDIAAGVAVDSCAICAQYAETALIRLRQIDRIAAGGVRRCNHSWSPCSHRDEDGLRSEAEMEHCRRCDEWYCREHHHMAPTGIERQLCAVCGEYQPRCQFLDYCEGHEQAYCSDHDHFDMCEYDDEAFEDGWDPGYTEAELLFEDGDDHEFATGKRFAAVEIEAEHGEPFILPYGFGMTTDGSLSGGGVEVTTPPARGAALIDRLKVAMATMGDNGWDVNSHRTSMHTHIDLRDKRNDKVFQSHLFATFYAIEDVLYAMQGRDRSGSGYADSLRQHWAFYDAYGKWAPDFDFVYNKMDKTVVAVERLRYLRNTKEGNRYIGFNFQSVVYRGSLEVRIHEGCLSWKRAALWIELLQFIIARVERGVTYPKLRRLLEMPVGTSKVEAMAKFFNLPAVVKAEMLDRLLVGGGSYLPSYRLGTPLKGRNVGIHLDSVLTLFECSECLNYVLLTSPHRQGGYPGHRFHCTRAEFDPDRDQLLDSTEEHIGTAAEVARLPGRRYAAWRRQAQGLLAMYPRLDEVAF